MQNISKEDYLSIIYKNKDAKGMIKANIIADKLNVSNPAVTDMLKKLSAEGYIDYEPYKGISLTGFGETFAKNMVRRHRIWEVFLNQIVGLPWDKVHEEANRLEHSSSDELINKLEEMLHFPEFDPHGDPIPSKEGKLPRQKNYIALADVAEGESGKVIRVNDFDEKFLNYISEIGIGLNKVIVVEEKRSFDNSLKIRVGDNPWNITKKLAENIFIEVKKK